MLKMYQAMANLEIAVESVLPGRVKDDFNFALTRDLGELYTLLHNFPATI